MLIHPLLCNTLPPAPCTLLIIGSLDTTLHEYLVMRGYHLIQQMDFTPPAVPVARVYCLEIGLIKDPLDDFNQLYSALPAQTAVYLWGTVCIQRQINQLIEQLPTLSFLLWQIQRCGFKLLAQKDLTTEISDFSLNPQHYAYIAIELQKTTPPRWQINQVSEKDSPAIRQLFNQVFTPKIMSEALWTWKYAAGRGIGMAAWTGTEMVAHYGGILRRILYFGNVKTAVQIADVMVLSTERGVLTKKGAFFLTAASFPEYFVGYGAIAWLGYGFPSERHLRLAQHLDLYAPVGRMVELTWQSEQTPPKLFSRIQHLNLETAEAVITQLWKNMANSLHTALLGVRDWDYLQYRYLQHPHNTYELLLVTHRLTGKPLGLAVIFIEGDICRLMDFIGSPQQLQTTIAQVRRVAGRRGLTHVSTWITENFSTMFPLIDAQQKPLDIQIPHSIWCQGIAPDVVKNHWWLMAGDTDFL
ncbi:GNAT family N-acetyltransferase [Beggiatoa leptomitoformis]|uniref:Uncharacterized protein n=1 Tax=Beggiatoa leptomitoformis TaxID=288004 RepID=A0A2N9YEP8_9GAMM|nr:GNAT family N-acetyltransferase [Beggiatoa leptomitoformis]ALG68695.2 hypothetical protein AL038_14520 [Beggiatoa leptomitoformis]AUI68952.2 hypothetical protein BLE401_09740 [Beggiatoa leptomitoformis]